MERTLLSLGPSGKREQHTKFADDTPCGLGILPDGKVVALTMFRKRLMVYADLTGIATGTIEDMIVDGATRVVAEGLRFPNGLGRRQPAGGGRDGRRMPR